MDRMKYRTSKEGLEHIKEFEQFRAKAYRPVQGDRWTIGWGNTFYKDGSPVKEGDIITMDEANELLSNIIYRFEFEINDLIKTELNQNQFDALLSFTYNVGTGNFKNSTLLKIVNQDPNNLKEIEKQFLRWDKSGGKIYKGLTRRRESEFELYSK